MMFFINGSVVASQTFEKYYRETCCYYHAQCILNGPKRLNEFNCRKLLTNNISQRRSSLHNYYCESDFFMKTQWIYNQPLRGTDQNRTHERSHEPYLSVCSCMKRFRRKTHTHKSDKFSSKNIKKKKKTLDANARRGCSFTPILNEYLFKWGNITTANTARIYNAIKKKKKKEKKRENRVYFHLPRPLRPQIIIPPEEQPVYSFIAHPLFSVFLFIKKSISIQAQNGKTITVEQKKKKNCNFVARKTQALFYHSFFFLPVFFFFLSKFIAFQRVRDYPCRCMCVCVCCIGN